MVSRVFLARKLETICGFMKVDKKISWNLEGFGGFMKWENEINWNHLVPRLGPYKFAGRSEEAKGRRRPPANFHGPSLCIRCFQFISVSHLMNTTKGLQVSTFFSTFMNTTNGFQVFLPKYSWILPKISKKLMNTRSQKNKICAVYVEILFWWYLGQEYSCDPF